jgi:hypothetical protein
MDVNLNRYIELMQPWDFTVEIDGRTFATRRPTVAAVIAVEAITDRGYRICRGAVFNYRRSLKHPGLGSMMRTLRAHSDADLRKLISNASDLADRGQLCVLALVAKSALMLEPQKNRYTRRLVSA